MNDVDPLAWLAQTLERIANRWPSYQINESCLGTTRPKRHRLGAYNTAAGLGQRPACGAGGRCHVDLVGRIAFQHLVLRDQTLRALGEEDFVAELDRRAHLAAFDQVGMGSKIE